MNARFASSDEIAIWNELVLKNPDGGNFLHTKEFAEQKIPSGWQPRYILAGDTAIVALEKSIPFFGKLWYLPKGPSAKTSGQLATIVPVLKSLAASSGVFAVKIEPEIEYTPDATDAITRLDLVPVRQVQPRSTVIIDLDKPLDAVMASLNQKGRHALRRAERDGVTVDRVACSDENCETMFRLYQITADGNFGIRPKRYYVEFWQRFEAAGMGQMFFARYQGELVAAAYAIVLGNHSVYKDGASLRERPVYGGSHWLQWDVIVWAKSRGSISHDLYGAPPSELKDDPAHPYYGIGRFKTSFNKTITDYVGAYDITIKPLQHRLWLKFGERIVYRLHRRRYHENLY